jgi:cell division protein FtsI (penicillin-binding protein 3)
MAPTVTGLRGSQRRIQLLAVVAVGAFLVLALRATWLGTVRASSLSARADQQHKVPIILPAERGAIISSDEEALAVDRPTVLVTADGLNVKDPAATAKTITSTTRGDAADRQRLERLLTSKKRYIVLAKHVSIKHADYLRSLKMPGVYFTRTSTRNYPKDKVAGQLVGFTNLDTGAGIEGLEKSRDDVLAGKAGKRVEIRDPRLRETVRITEARDPKPGADIELTVNAKIQERFETILAGARRKYGAKSAMGVIMDPNTGAIIAMTSVPRVNPNDRARLDPATTQNRSLTDPYEPGSVFKPFIVAGALEEGLVTPTTPFYELPTKETFAENTPDEFTVNEAHRTEVKTLTTSEIIQESSNIGALRVSRTLRKRNLLRSWIVKFGFGEPTNIDLAAENKGKLPKPKWNIGQLNNIPLGQGLTATQVQQVRAYAAIANGGFLVQPHVVARVGGHDVAPTERTRILSKQTSIDLTKILQTVVEGSDGTAVKAHLEGYDVAGKTGTAQLVDPTTQKYVDRYRSSFIGYVPARKPRMVIAVMLDDPDPLGPHTGGQVAAPAFQKIADYALSALAVPHP